VIRKRFRLTLATAAATATLLAAAFSIGAPASSAHSQARAVSPAAAPTASQLLAKAQSCTPASNGEYATDDGEASTVVDVTVEPWKVLRRGALDIG